MESFKKFRILSNLNDSTKLLSFLNKFFMVKFRILSNLKGQFTIFYGQIENFGKFEDQNAKFEKL